MDNRGNNRDSGRNGNNDRGGDASSSSSSQQRRTEEEETSNYRSQIAPRSTNITTHRVVPQSNIITERFYSYGVGPGIPLKPGGKSAAIVAIQ